jgi:lactate permease
MLPFLDFLSRYPFELKYRFFTGPGGKDVSFQLFTNPGTLILISAVLGGLLQGLTAKKLLITAGKTLKQMAKTIITVASIVALARIMGYSGMISSIASAMSAVTGSYFPLISPFIGALGTFITGSDTSSNVLFGELQKQTALQINSNASWIVAANASGATAGKMVSPQSIAIAATATGLTGSEGKILARTIKYAAIFVALIGLLVYIVNLFL